MRRAVARTTTKARMARHAHRRTAGFHGSAAAASGVRRTRSLVNGKFFESKSSSWIPIHCPASGKVIAEVPESTPQELDEAASCAQEAFQGWRSTPVSTRIRSMFELQRKLNENFDDLARAVSEEQGKTFADAKGDVFRGVEVVEHSCSAGSLMMGETIEGVSRDMDTYSYRQPLGVTAGICPFNFPAMIPLWMFPLALVTGNTHILKPSERDPEAGVLIAELAQQCGLPPGVLNIVHGTKDTVNFLCDAPQVQAISFVGGDTAGHHIHARGTANGKRVQSNMAAKNHGVVLPDANKDAALNAIIGAAFGAAGQRCMALSTCVLVGEAGNWMDDLVAKASALKLGHGMDPKADLGPMISPAALSRAEGLIQSGVDEGATLRLDGRGAKVEGYEGGNWLAPTILDNVTTDMKCYKEEIFGPALVVLRVNTLDEALDMIAANPYGNGAAVFTRSGAAARRFQYEVAAGQVGVNVPIPVPLPFFSFTGSRASHVGGYHFYGKMGLEFFTQVKTITSLWREDEVTKVQTSFPTPQ